MFKEMHMYSRLSHFYKKSSSRPSTKCFLIFSHVLVPKVYLKFRRCFNVSYILKQCHIHIVLVQCAVCLKFPSSFLCTSKSFFNFRLSSTSVLINWFLIKKHFYSFMLNQIGKISASNLMCIHFLPTLFNASTLLLSSVSVTMSDSSVFTCIDKNTSTRSQAISNQT